MCLYYRVVLHNYKYVMKSREPKHHYLELSYDSAFVVLGISGLFTPVQLERVKPFCKTTEFRLSLQFVGITLKRSKKIIWKGYVTQEAKIILVFHVHAQLNLLLDNHSKLATRKSWDR